ncbi:hypothetical protein QBC34DRAFT_142611 [Podospora aff. communis PSN243]|uniref:Uncharacterized protein n=1 Tax=Podospora aff. communis PSN243 TaxID=3040156 RepID=A0AAV9GF43_9PEZI|nr:hypothetical protein QBC34DRAFT_142611 [Podospora aff. communis PSN243]
MDGMLDKSSAIHTGSGNAGHNWTFYCSGPPHLGQYMHPGGQHGIRRSRPRNAAEARAHAAGVSFSLAMPLSRSPAVGSSARDREWGRGKTELSRGFRHDKGGKAKDLGPLYIAASTSRSHRDASAARLTSAMRHELGRRSIRPLALPPTLRWHSSDVDDTAFALFLLGTLSRIEDSICKADKASNRWRCQRRPATNAKELCSLASAAATSDGLDGLLGIWHPRISLSHTSGRYVDHQRQN